MLRRPTLYQTRVITSTQISTARVIACVETPLDACRDYDRGGSLPLLLVLHDKSHNHKLTMGLGQYDQVASVFQIYLKLNSKNRVCLYNIRRLLLKSTYQRNNT